MSTLGMMTRTRGIVGGAAAALALAALLTSFASCATTEDGANEPAEGAVLPPPPANDAGADGDAQLDAGCDASDSTCVSHVITCAEAAWCPVKTSASALYALTSVWGSSKSDVWAVGSGGTIIHFDGTAWSSTPTSPAIKNTFRAVTGSAPNDVWAISATDVMFHSKGVTPAGAPVWTPVTAAADEFSGSPIYAAWGTATGDLVIGGSSFTVIAPNGDWGSGNLYTKGQLADGGYTWTGSGTQAVVRGIWGSAADDLWVVADNRQSVSWQLGIALHGTRASGDGGGLVWQNVDTQSSVELTAIWGGSRTDIWAVGELGSIRHLAKNGTQWDAVASNTTERLNGLWGASATDIWAVGDSGTILHYDGTRWSPSKAAFAIGKKPHLYGVWGSSSTDVWIVGDGIALHHTGGAK